VLCVVAFRGLGRAVHAGGVPYWDLAVYGIPKRMATS